ncbi:MAG TPA: hypothetical protein PLE25_06345, partial [Spirochaetales bacterium]|nr:hypothetical protein [Spirochaetales bacterium]
MILLKDCFRVVRPRYGAGADAGSVGDDLSGVDVLIDGKRIAKIGKALSVPAGDCKVIDASRHVVMPGLVNTHHHYYQTLTRNVPAVQDAKLFDWLVYLY